jgi:hypothetical protein
VRHAANLQSCPQRNGHAYLDRNQKIYILGPDFCTMLTCTERLHVHLHSRCRRDG